MRITCVCIYSFLLLYMSPVFFAPHACIYLNISLVLPIFHSVGMVPSPPPPPAPVFHERQRMLCCGTHTLNNLYQHKWIDSAAMDKLASYVLFKKSSIFLIFSIFLFFSIKCSCST